MQLLPRVKNAPEVWITGAIFMEVGNALSTYDRRKVSAFIQHCLICWESWVVVPYDH